VITLYPPVDRRIGSVCGHHFLLTLRSQGKLSVIPFSGLGIKGRLSVTLFVGTSKGRLSVRRNVKG